METPFALLLADYCLEVRPGQNVLVEAETPALPLVEALYKAVLARGGYPQLQLEYPQQALDFYRLGGGWLETIPVVRKAALEAADSTLRIKSEQNPLALAGVNPALVSRHQKAWSELAEIRRKKRWCLTLYPTPGYAEQAGMSLPEFRRFVERALYLDQQNPVAGWRELAGFQAALIERLKRVRKVVLEAAGTHLELSVEGRSWINSDGKRNMPSGEVFTGPHESSANGEVTFNLPAVASGHPVNGVYLRFEKGRVVEARAQEGEEFLLRMLDTDQGSRQLGELGIGTNYGIDRPTGIVLFDEKIGGSVHLALGNSYPETGGVNKSAVHWDLVLDLRKGGRLLADGEVLQDNGKFVGL